MLISTEQQLGALVRERRKQQGLTMEDLAAVAQCSPRLLSELERGKRGVSISMVLYILSLLGFEFHLLPREGEQDTERNFEA